MSAPTKAEIEEEMGGSADRYYSKLRKRQQENRDDPELAKKRQAKYEHQQAHWREK